MAGFDPADPYTAVQPPPTLAGVDGPDLSGTTVGIYRDWFEDAEPDVISAAEAALRSLEARGATVREVELPDLELARVAHLISIASEMLTSMTPLLADHRSQMGLDVRINLTLAAQLTGVDYVMAQRARTRVYDHFARVLEDVDAIATPTTGRTAPAILPDALAVGESDLESLSALMRFVFPSNLTGHPAISVPAGYDGGGLPVGLQLIGRPWEEHRILQLAAAVEQGMERREPAVAVRLLAQGQ
jgi:Asp-tRNA(Asn)/Glu-tRNA(Gln) amidotransferase A subunit family amidase